MLDNLVVERFREEHGNEELKKHLCLYPSTGLQDLIGVCVRFETHVESAFRGSAGLLGCRIFDYTGTTVTVHTRHDQRAIDVGVCDSTTRVMVPRRVDR